MSISKLTTSRTLKEGGKKKEKEEKKLGLEDRKDARGGEERTEVFLFKDWHKPVCIK